MGKGILRGSGFPFFIVKNFELRWFMSGITRAKQISFRFALAFIVRCSLAYLRTIASANASICGLSASFMRLLIVTTGSTISTAFIFSSISRMIRAA